MSLQNTPLLIVEDEIDFRETVVYGLQNVLEWEIYQAWTAKEAEDKLLALKEEWIQKLILILDGHFPWLEWWMPRYHWKYVLEVITNNFWPEFLLYLIPFSSDDVTNGEMKTKIKDDPRVRVLEWENTKSLESVITAVQSIEWNKIEEMTQEEIDSCADYFFEILLVKKWWTDDFKPHTSISDARIIRAQLWCHMKEAILIRNTMIQRHIEDILAMDVKIAWKNYITAEDLDVNRGLISLALRTQG